MTADRKRPTGPPPSAGVLARYAQAYAREVGVAEGRVRAWVAYMIMAGALERATGVDGPQFIVKGGVALELRLRDRARATKDIDVVLRDKEADLADALEQVSYQSGDEIAILVRDAAAETVVRLDVEVWRSPRPVVAGSPAPAISAFGTSCPS